MFSRKNSNCISPFAGGPSTIETTDTDGTKQITVTAKAITPLRARLADWLSNLFAAALFCGAVYGSTLLGDAPAWQFAALLLTPFCGAARYSRRALLSFQKKWACNVHARTLHGA